MCVHNVIFRLNNNEAFANLGHELMNEKCKFIIDFNYKNSFVYWNTLCLPYINGIHAIAFVVLWLLNWFCLMYKVKLKICKLWSVIFNFIMQKQFKYVFKIIKSLSFAYTMPFTQYNFVSQRFMYLALIISACRLVIKLIPFSIETFYCSFQRKSSLSQLLKSV